MKKLITILLITLLLVPASLAVLSGSNSPQVKATLVSQTPDPVEPGQVVTVKFKIENDGGATSQDTIAKINPVYPFSLHGDVAEKNIGNILSSAVSGNAVIVEFKLKVDKDAPEGETEIELRLTNKEGSGIAYVNDDFLIDIQTNDAVLDITSIKTEPTQIAPGEAAKVHITVKNLADSLLRDIKFKLDFDDDDLPLAPYQSSSERRLAQLDSEYQDTLSFNIIASPDAAPGLYKVPVTITYNDEQAKAYSISDILAVSVGDTPKIKPFIRKSSTLKSASPGKITLGIANAGTTDVKFVELFILPSEDYQLVSTSDYFYIGDIDSDDTESEELDIYINSRTKKLSLPVKLKYVDANNKPFQQQFDLEMNLYSSSQLRRFGVLAPSKAGSTLFLIIIIAGVILYYKRYYKKPENNFKNDVKSLLHRVFHKRRKKRHKK